MAVKVESVSRVKAHQRYYLDDGTQVAGVTSILSILAKPALIPWANALGLQGINVKDYVDALADIGTLAHYMVQCHLGGVKPDLTSYSPEQINRAENSVLKFFFWQDAHKIEVVSSEKPFISQVLRFGGTVDIIARVDGVLELADLKTARALYIDHTIQVAAYVLLAQENGYAIERARILRIGRTEDEGFEEKVFSVSALSAYQEIFKHALEIHRLQQQIRRVG